MIDYTVLQEILPRGSSPCVLYGLPKVHKTGYPFRPIVSSVNTYNYNLASYLVGILQPISTNQHTVKDSFRFADWAKSYKHNNGMMCSFEVCSLLTNVPLDETIQICLDKLHTLPDSPAIPRSVLKKLLEFATKKNTLSSMVSITTRLMTLPWVHCYCRYAWRDVMHPMIPRCVASKKHVLDRTCDGYSFCVGNRFIAPFIPLLSRI